MTTPPLNLRPTTPPDSPSASDFSYESSPHLYLFTSLTAGSSHIITATSRLETILKANRVPFKAVDCATDEKARRIWSRRAGKRKLPGLVKEGMILADLEQVEEWNEFGEIKENLGGGVPAAPPQSQPTAAAAAPVKPAAPPAAPERQEPALSTTGQTAQQQQQSLLAREAAARGAQRGKTKPVPVSAPSTASTLSDTPAAAAAAAAEPAVPVEATGPVPAAPASELSPTRPSPPRSPEMDEDRDIDSDKHNTSSSTALPPLSIRTKDNSPLATQSSDTSATAAAGTEINATTGTSAADAVNRARADTATSLTSPAMPSAPPPSAIEPSSAATGAGLGVSSVDAALGGAKRRHGSGSDIISGASPEQIKQIESQDSIPEHEDEDEEGGNYFEEGDTRDGQISPRDIDEDDDEYGGPQTPHSPKPDTESETPVPEDEKSGNQGGQEGKEDDEGEMSPRILQGDRNRHITFQEDGIKGDPKAADRAGESVGD